MDVAQLIKEAQDQISMGNDALEAYDAKLAETRAERSACKARIAEAERILRALQGRKPREKKDGESSGRFGDRGR